MPYGRDLFGDPVRRLDMGPIHQRFTMPPFSVLDARQGEWQERKRAWTALGLQGELGREERNLLGYGADFIIPGKYEGYGDWVTHSSIFDPVLCELIYRWFCPAGGQIVDPFAGGSVRGVVAAALGRQYWGCDLRAEQIEANRNQSLAILQDVGGPRPVWICGDSSEELMLAPACDLVFSCPPYGDLEAYSPDDARDLSSMSWEGFLEAYRGIIRSALIRLRDHSFAVFVVGDFRDKAGFYRNFVGATSEAFIERGALLYNDAVLVTAVGTAAVRVTKQFAAGRKMVKTHQNVLVFCKGDWKKATLRCLEPEEFVGGVEP